MSKHCGGIGFRGDVTEVVLDRDFGVPTTGSRVDSDADPDRHNKVGETV